MTFEFPETDLIGCKFPELTGRNGEVKVPAVGKEYIYRLLPGQPKPRVGDFVVTSCVNGFQVCIVTTLNVPTTKFKDVAYVVGVVDATAYTETLRRQAMKEELYKQLMAKKKELEDIVTFDLLAEKSPEFKDLWEAYKHL